MEELRDCPGDARRLLLLCHRGDFEHLYQATSAAAAATAGGWRVDLVFYFDALARLISGRLDDPPSPSGEWTRGIADRLDDLPLPLPSQHLAAARATGRARVFACSASLRLVETESVVDRSGIDEVVGWPTVLDLMTSADQTLYL